MTPCPRFVRTDIPRTSEICPCGFRADRPRAITRVRMPWRAPDRIRRRKVKTLIFNPKIYPERPVRPKSNQATGSGAPTCESASERTDGRFQIRINERTTT